MAYDATFRVWRGDSGGGELETYTVQVNEGEVVLDIIHRLQATQAHDLAVRWNCKAGKCGSCSAEINGRPRLMCLTRMNTFTEDETVTVTPLRTFPVIRDLVRREVAAGRVAAPDPHGQVVAHQWLSSNSAFSSSGICGNGLRPRVMPPRCSVTTRLTLPQSGSVAG